MKKPIVKYLLKVTVFVSLLGVVFLWGMATTPLPVKKQMVVCYKFTEKINKNDISKHMSEFRDLKKTNVEIVEYSSGLTSNEGNTKPQYDVMHYLTFRTDSDVTKFKNSDSFKTFIKNNKENWEAEFVLNAEIK